MTTEKHDNDAAPTTQLATTTETQRAVTPSVAPLSEIAFDAARIFTSIDTSTEYGRAVTMVMMQSGTAAPLTEHLNVPIPVQDFIVHTVQFVDKDGVDVVADRIVLISPDGKAYAATSNGVRRSLQMLMVMFGVPPYKPAKVIKAVGVKTRGGFSAVTLVPVLDSLKPSGEVKPLDPAPAAAKRK